MWATSTGYSERERVREREKREKRERKERETV